MEHKIAVEVLEFIIVHQDHFVIGMSAPPPTNVDPSELTSVSQPTSVEPDVAELSESDEELGELIIHEGGGAKIARSSTTSTPSTKRKEGGLFARIGRNGGNSPDPSARTTDNLSQIPAPQTVSYDETSPTSSPAVDKGKVQELGLGEPPSLFGGKAGVRRSRTTPTRKGMAGKKAVDEDGKRSASGPGGPLAPKERLAAGGTNLGTGGDLMTRSVSQGNEPKKEEGGIIEEMATETKRQEAAETKSSEVDGRDAPLTPPPSKLIDNPVTSATAEGGAAE